MVQEAQQAVQDIHAGAFDAFSVPALKVSWNVAKGLPQPPGSAGAASTSDTGSKLKQTLSEFDCTMPLVVDVGCGLGSFARAMVVHPRAINCHNIVPCANRLLTPPACFTLGVDAVVSSLRVRCYMLQCHHVVLLRIVPSLVRVARQNALDSAW